MSGWYLVQGIRKARVWESYSLEMRAGGSPILRPVPWPDMRQRPDGFHAFQAVKDIAVRWPFRTDLSLNEMVGAQPNWRRLAPEIGLSYTFTDPLTEESRGVTVSIPFVPDSRGRPWFLCPRCGRRCGKLYLPAWGWEFWCRLCHGLHYRKAFSSDPVVQFVEIWEVAALMTAYGLNGQGYYVDKLKSVAHEVQAALRGQRLSRHEKWRLENERQRAQDMGLLAQWSRAQAEGRKFVFPERPPSPWCQEAARMRRSVRMKIACGRLGPDEALCLRCHARREIVDGQPFMMKSGRRALRGKCVSCGGTVTRIIPSQEGLCNEGQALLGVAVKGSG